MKESHCSAAEINRVESHLRRNRGALVAHQLPAMLALDAGLCKVVPACYASAQRASTFGRKERTTAR